jgi:hypothetical protein
MYFSSMIDWSVTCPAASAGKPAACLTALTYGAAAAAPPPVWNLASARIS